MLRKRFCILLATLLLITALSPMLVSAEVGDTIKEEHEPNGFYSDSFDPMSNDDTYIGRIVGDDVDVFYFSVSKPSEFYVICTSDSNTIAMALLDRQENILASCDSEYLEGYYHNLVYGTLDTGMYYIVLANNDTSINADYMLYLYHAPTSVPPTTTTTTTTTKAPTTTTTVHQHSFVSTVVAPTCMAYGYTIYSCSTCDYSYEADHGNTTGAHAFSGGSDVCDVCGVVRVDAPTVIAYDHSTVILQEVDGCEYSMNGVSFQPIPLFTDLAPSATYHFYQRIAAKDGLPAGEISPSVKVLTDPKPTAAETTTTVTTTDTTDTTATTVTVPPTVITLTHSESGVSISATDDVIDSDCVLRVYTLSQNKRNAQLYMLVTKGDDIIHPSGSMAVTLPIPDGVIGDDLHLLSTDASGNIIEIDAIYDGNALQFETDTLGNFTIESIVPEGLGDVNKDGKVNIMDAVQLYYHVNGKITLSDLTNAELTGDGKINIADAVTLYYFVNGKTDTL